MIGFIFNCFIHGPILYDRPYDKCIHCDIEQQRTEFERGVSIQDAQFEFQRKLFDAKFDQEYKQSKKGGE